MILTPLRLPLLALHAAAIVATHIVAGAALTAAGTALAVMAVREMRRRAD